MDPELQRHIADTATPSWLLVLIGGAIVGAVSWLIRTLIGEKEGKHYTKEEADRRFVLRDDQRSSCSAHLSECREAHGKAEQALREHSAAGAHPATGERLAALESEVRAIRETTRATDEKVDRLLDHVLTNGDRESA